MGIWGSVLGLGLGAAGSLFGGHHGDNGYSADMQHAMTAYGDANSNYGTIRNYGQTNLGNWNTDNPLYRTSMLNLAQQLGQAPTAQQKAQYMGEVNNNVGSIYAKTRAQLLSDAANRGIDTAGDAGTQSSVLGGGLATLGQGQANALANAETNYYNQYESPDAARARLMQQGQIYGDLAHGDWTQGIGALGDSAQGYLNVGRGWQGIAGQVGQQNQQQQQNEQGVWGGLGSGLGTILKGIKGF